MTIKLDAPARVTCENCHGSREQWDGAAFPANGEPPDRARNVSEPELCYVCSGYGAKKRSYGEYKSQRAADAGLARRTGVRCSLCKGTGKVRRCEVPRACYTCSGRGWQPTYTGEPLPPEVGLCESSRAMYYRAWLADVGVTVVRRDGGQSWLEHNLGLGLVSVTDYGRMWNLHDDVAAQTVVEEMCERDRGAQYVGFHDRETRAPARECVLLLNRSGYSVVCSATRVSGLPPTYTPELLLSEAA